jgi:hypothetical protein
VSHLSLTDRGLDDRPVPALLTPVTSVPTTAAATYLTLTLEHHVGRQYGRAKDAASSSNR